MTVKQIRDAIEYIRTQARRGYIDLGSMEFDEIQVVLDALAIYEFQLLNME